jgi:hypothetical protein
MITKISNSKKIPHSRIWIEGSRLIEAGFTHGTRYDVSRTLCGIVISAHPEGKRRVAGAPQRPIIDITGAIVRDNFRSDFAEVAFGHGVITAHDTATVAAAALAPVAPTVRQSDFFTA